MKIKELQQYLIKRNIDVALFFNLQHSDPNLFYFSQLSNLSFACLAIPKETKPVLFVSSLDYERAKSESKLNVKLIKKSISEAILNYFGKDKIKTIGINKSNLTITDFKLLKNKLKKIKFNDLNQICSLLRGEKTEKEIEFISKACKITDNALNEVINKFKKFKTETQVGAELNYLAKKEFADTAFKTIVASGKNSSFPHHETKNHQLQKGFCVIDFGVKYKGYCSDITRTLYLGNPNKAEKGVYNLVLESQKKAIISIGKEISCLRIDKIARERLGKYKRLFIHGLGHGIGIEPHEMPTLSPRSNEKIKNNMVFTIEPGIYFPNKFGIRIEDDILFSAKPKTLTKTEKNLVIIKR